MPASKPQAASRKPKAEGRKLPTIRLQTARRIRNESASHDRPAACAHNASATAWPASTPRVNAS
ncbi:hypothetical protein, partial [Methylibium sp.]|uniref:hypothetical protein n=1 Tax=Methylibium sp. TaxID=2067992 RepID=UPI00286CD52F